MKIRVKGWSCNRFRLFLHESAALMCRKMSNYNLLCYSRIGSMMEEKGDEHNTCECDAADHCNGQKIGFFRTAKKIKKGRDF